MNPIRGAYLVALLLGFVPSTLAGPCQNVVPRYQVAATSHQNVGGIEPTNLVTLGTRVRLFGIARTVGVTPNCAIVFTPLPFSWSLTFQAPGAYPVPATLDKTDTLQPEFDANAIGAYVAELDVGPVKVYTRIETTDGLRWFSIGPYGEPAGNPFVGRANALAFDPADATLYAGTALGGVFVSTDLARSWTAMTDHKGLPTLGIGALAVGADGGLYAGTGDIHNGDRALPPPSGSGIWKSSDKGLTWSPAGTTVGGNCPNGSSAFTSNARKIVAHPNKAGLIYVASDQGLLRTMDGGNCWNMISNVNATDVVMEPSTPTTLYLAVPGRGNNILKTVNAEDPTPVFSPLALPLNDNYGWVLLAAALTAPKTIYAALATDVRTDFLRTTDGGASWFQGPSQNDCAAGGCASDMALGVSPVDAGRVVYGRRYPAQSIDGIQTWIDLRSDGGHMDYHAMVFAPNHLDWLYAANDGGVLTIILPPKQNPNPVFGWEAQNLGLNIAQSPGLAIAANDSNLSSIGVWDNGSQSRTLGRTWNEIFGAGRDGFYAAIDASPIPAYYYSGSAADGQSLARSDGKTATVIGTSNDFWSNPYKVAELASSGANARAGAKFYVAENANTDAMMDWRCADPDPDPANADNAWDFEFAPGGWYFATHTDGSIWRFQLDPNLPVVDCGANQTNAQSITKIFQAPNPAFIRVSLDPFNVGSLYAVVGSSQDARRILHLTQAQGKWTAAPLAGAAGNPGALPNVLNPSQWIQADPEFPGLLYVGTLQGLWQGALQNDGSWSWTLNADIPDTQVMQIVPHRSVKGYSKVLRLDTNGRGVWERFPKAVSSTRPQVPSCFYCEPYEPYNPEPAAKLPVSDYAAWISVPYSYAGPDGTTASLRVIPTIDGVTQPYFVTKPQQIAPGSGWTEVQVWYAKAGAPLGLRTNGLRVVITPEEGPTASKLSEQKSSLTHSGSPSTHIKRNSSSTTLPLAKWWVTPEGRLLTVDAQMIDPTPVSVPSVIKIRVNGRVVEGRTPMVLPVPRNAHVIVQAALETPVRGRKARFQTWTENGALAGNGRTVELTVRANTRAVAHFRVADSAPRKTKPPSSP